ncbi:MAG: peptidylprolyl isomerase [Oligoflexia bacterium]|nr:peptidylprolyl isomerase [Oligoflexia bacterium]
MFKITALLFLFVYSLSANSATEKQVVLKINNRIVTNEEFNKRFDDARKLVNPPSSKAAFLEDLINYEIGVQEAEKRNVAKDPIVAERIRQQLYVGLLEMELGKKANNISISEEEKMAFYKTTPQLRSSHILIEIKPNATASEKAQAKKRALDILNEVRSSKKSFEDLVKLYTDDLVTKARGGDVGYQSSLTINPDYYGALLKLRVGEVAPSLIETKYGFHIAKLTGKLSYEDADKNLIVNPILEKKKIDLFKSYFNSLRKKYKITTNTNALK